MGVGRAPVLGDAECLERAEKKGVLVARHHADEATEPNPGFEGVGAGGSVAAASATSSAKSPCPVLCQRAAVCGWPGQARPRWGHCRPPDLDGHQARITHEPKSGS